MTTVQVRREPCSACPYRKDCESGVWSEADYEKLPAYDAETWEQPTRAFSCHATPEHLCHGWAIVGGYHNLALRLIAAREGFEGIPDPFVPLFSTHTEAALHGLRDIEDPSDEAVETIERLARKYPRIEHGA